MTGLLLNLKKGKIYVNTTNNHSYRWSGSYLIDLDSNWSQGIKDLQENTIRTDEQTLSADKQKQVFENLGWKVYVSTSDVIIANSAIPDDVMEEIVNCQAILLSDTGKMLFKGNQDTNIIYFLTFGYNNNVQELVVRPTNKTSQSLQSSPINDQYAVKYSTTQNLTDAQQDISLHNIGLDFVHIDYSILGTTVTDAQAESIINSRGIILSNFPANLNLPTIYYRGREASEIVAFVALGGSRDAYYIQYNANTKALEPIVHNYTDNGCVRYGDKQSLTTTQQEIALGNIGFPLVHLDFGLIGTTLDDDTYNAVVSAKGIILENVPDGNNTPSLYLVGISDSVTTIFVSEFNARVWFVLTLSHTSKSFSLISTGYSSDVIKYGDTQSLTAAQQDVALANIGLNLIHLPYSKLGTTLSDDDYTALHASNGFILTEASGPYAGVSLFFKSRYISGTDYFVAFLSTNVLALVSVNASNKALSSISTIPYMNGAVMYTDQTLDDSEKLQARTNIGVLSPDELINGTNFISELRTKLGLDVEN